MWAGWVRICSELVGVHDGVHQVDEGGRADGSGRRIFSSPVLEPRPAGDGRACRPGLVLDDLLHDARRKACSAPSRTCRACARTGSGRGARLRARCLPASWTHAAGERLRPLEDELAVVQRERLQRRGGDVALAVHLLREAMSKVSQHRVGHAAAAEDVEAAAVPVVRVPGHPTEIAGVESLWYGREYAGPPILSLSLPEASSSESRISSASSAGAEIHASSLFSGSAL
jgi:hypothetical protein